MKIFGYFTLFGSRDFNRLQKTLHFQKALLNYTKMIGRVDRQPYK
jgi:hypothetical protein